MTFVPKTDPCYGWGKGKKSNTEKIEVNWVVVRVRRCVSRLRISVCSGRYELVHFYGEATTIFAASLFVLMTTGKIEM